GSLGFRRIDYRNNIGRREVETRFWRCCLLVRSQVTRLRQTRNKINESKDRAMALRTWTFRPRLRAAASTSRTWAWARARSSGLIKSAMTLADGSSSCSNPNQQKLVHRMARESLQSSTAGECADLRRRDAGPERVPHTGQSIDDDRLSHEQADCDLKDDEVR